MNRTTFLGLLFLVVVVCCVSKTATDQRFRESLELSLPTLNVTIADSNNFTFAAVGDLHLGTDTSRFRTILDAAQNEGDSFIVLLGDIVDTAEAEQFQAYKDAVSAKGWNGKILPVIGNHDVFEDGWEQWKTTFGPATYDVRLGNVRFLALDSADGTVGLDQQEWMRSRLENRGSETHTFVLSHYLPVTPGIRTYLRLSDDLEATTLMKLARNFSVAAWLGGHYHSYALGEVEKVKYLLAGGGGGRRMDPVWENFFVQVRVAGQEISFERKRVE